MEVHHKATSKVKFDRAIIVGTKLVQDIKFLIRFGETRTLLKCKKVGKCATPVDVTGKREQLLAIIEKGKDEFGKVVCERMLACGVI